MKKNLLMIFIIFSLLILVIGTIIFINIKKNNDNVIPDDYIAIFHGNDNEKIYETYIYKNNNTQDNAGFNYLNVIKNKDNNSNSIKILKRGSVQWTDDVFKVAKDNNAYLYVTLPNSDKKYTIEDYMKIFLKD